MSRDFRITSTIGFNNPYFPVGAFFNCIPDSEFMDVLNYLINGVGFHYEEAGCAFPDSIDPWEEPYEGLKFSVMNESIVVSFREAYYYLQLACKAYIEDNPKDKEGVEELEQKFFNKYCA